MQRAKRAAGAAVTIFGLLAAPAAAGDSRGGAAIGTVRAATAEERSVAVFDPAPPHGIRSHGKRARHADVERVPVSGPVAPTTAAGDEGDRAAASTRISGLPMAGRVTAFALDPTGARAVYIADQDVAGRLELYSVLIDGSAAPVKISAGLAFGSGDLGVATFEIRPDGSGVVFLADSNLGGGLNDIYSVPTDGSAAPVRLNGGTQAPVSGFGITPDGLRALFLAPASNGATELFAATIGTLSSARQISDAGATQPQGDVVSVLFSPDGARAVYAADAVADGVFQWFSVAVNATGPGSDVQLSGALGSVHLGTISPDSGRLIYTGDDLILGRFDLFSIPLAGGAKLRLNGAMAGLGVRAIAVSALGDRVGYIADQQTLGVPEVYSALVATAGSGTRLNTPLSGLQTADTINISPDGTRAIYEADQVTPGTFELFSAPIDGGATPTMLHGLTAPANVGYFDGLGVPIVGRRAVYPVLASTVELYAVPFDGSEAPQKVNPPLPLGHTLRNAFVPTASTRLVAYGTGASSGSRTVQAWSAPVRGDLPAEQFNVTAAAGAMGVQVYEIDAGERYGVYVQDQATSGKLELWSRPLDSDADTVLNVADNCTFVANPAQDAVVFPYTVLAESKVRFGWAAPTEVRFARGPLDSVASLVTNGSGTLSDATSYTDATTPGAGTGLYYLFAPDCPGRSYQSELGIEPGRDTASLP